MPIAQPQTRRDPRFSPRRGSATVDFEIPVLGGARETARLTEISVSGLAIRLAGPIEGVEPGSRLMDTTLRIGDCEIRGEVAIRNARRLDDGAVELGCLFYAASEAEAKLFMALLAGMQAVSPD